MNRQDNRRATKEGPSDLNQNLCLPKNRSWPRINSTAGQYRAIDEPLLECERNFAVAALDGAKDYRDGDYEDPELHVVEAWKSIQILPARPIKESEYADTRYFKGVMDTPHPLDTKTSVPTERHPWHTQMGLEKVDKPIFKDSRSQHVKGDRPTKGNKTPLPPPRQINLKDLSEVLGTERVPHYQMKPESIHLSQNQSTPEIPLAIASSPFMTRNHSVQNRDHKESMQFHPPQRCQSPARFSSQENLLHHKNTSWRKPFPTRSDAKDVQQSDWYIGEQSRKAVEEALRKENKDGTFLVRDCSTKSRAEPYVLVVFYGNKVYNVKIRFLEKNQQFALGTGLRGDEKFNSVEDIIEHYKYFPIVLIDGKDKTGIHREQCYLTQPLPLSRCVSPW
ncbi:cytokine-dependent hematopoietic cell linker isoform X2 [Eumetopias jubatus]|uniref:cytokine-dependent hematopoietic cell linker isoform X2 n=1 Tax=Eumetopias jubatus TaxID=34886 RepID=UPI0010163321|nr:cytokine-dependent hematopoietic cell linker isoform X2 [Eumetopias jubatus]